jgi:probable HAF family extracellular repeat protein
VAGTWQCSGLAESFDVERRVPVSKRTELLARSGRRFSAVVSLLAVASLSLPAAALAQPTIMSLGVLPGGISSVSGGISPQGDVAGSGDTTASGRNFRAFLWRPGTGLTNLGALGSDSFGLGINDVGQVVGRTRVSTGATHAFIWDSVGGMRDLGTLAGGSTSTAYAINGSGVAVGESNASDGEFHAVRWSATGVIAPLGTLPGGSSSTAYAVNNLGAAAGEALDASGNPRAVIWDPSGSISLLPALPGGLKSGARGINDAGHVVGYSDMDTPTGRVTRAVLWHDGIVEDLGALPAWSGATAFGVNASGQVAGEARLTAGSALRGFVWTRAGGMQELGLLPGGSFSSAAGLSDAGRILGFANASDGESRAVIWTINRAPTATAQSLTTAQDTAVPVALNGSDPDGDPLAFTVTVSPANGTLSGSAPNFLYTPNPGFSGTDRITFTVSDGALSSAPVQVTITVTPAPPGGGDPAPSPSGSMYGLGRVDTGGVQHNFAFRVKVKKGADPHGWLAVWFKHVKPAAKKWDEANSWSHFHATSVKVVSFSDNPALTPSARRKVLVDSVAFSGTGRWNGKKGYSFEASASDAGEPGRGRDTFSITVKDPSGAVVATFEGTLAAGNVQAQWPVAPSTLAKSR